MAASGEPHAIIRDGVIRELRGKAHALAEAGIGAAEIRQRLMADWLTEPERELVKLLALSAEARMRGLPVADVLDSELRERQWDASP